MVLIFVCLPFIHTQLRRLVLYLTLFVLVYPTSMHCSLNLDNSLAFQNSLWKLTKGQKQRLKLKLSKKRRKMTMRRCSHMQSRRRLSKHGGCHTSLMQTAMEVSRLPACSHKGVNNLAPILLVRHRCPAFDHEVSYTFHMHLVHHTIFKYLPAKGGRGVVWYHPHTPEIHILHGHEVTSAI